MLRPFFAALLRQTDPHWTAVVFNTDPKGPHDETLKRLVEKAGDSRVQYMEVPEQSRPKVGCIVIVYF